MVAKPDTIPLLSPASPDHEDYYCNLVDQLPAAVYTCDTAGYIRHYNKAAVELWGRAPEIGKDLWCGSWKIFTVSGDRMQLDQCPMAVALRERRPVTGEEIIVERPDGERRNVLPHPQPIYDGNGHMTGAMNMLVDITEHKRVQAANQQLKQYNEQLEQFAYAASHDLQEPLRKINTFATMLAERAGPQLDDTMKLYLSKISSSSQRMSHLISDLLVYTCEANIHGQMEPVRLNEVVGNILSDLELPIREKEAIISYRDLPVIRAVPAQIGRLLYNLINNALKFARTDVPARIEITSRRERSFIELVVKDNGIGFEPVYAERIFELFQRLNDRHTYGGNGLGLSICRKIVESHDGTIFAESVPGKGAAFHIHLPVELLVAP